MLMNGADLHGRSNHPDAVREVLADAGLCEPNTIEPPCIAAMKVVAAQKIDLFDAAGKAALS